MADIRFKIDGSNPPFNVRVERNGNLVCSEVFEFSGATNGNIKDEGHTCAIIGNLNLSTSYDVIVTDSIGNVSSPVSITTPSLPIVIPVEKTISLGGTVSTLSETSQTLSGSKNLLTFPELESGESFDVELCLETVASGGFRSTSSTAIVYKSTDGGSSYTEVLNVVDGSDDSVWINVGPTDAICYDLLSVASTSGDNTSSASIEITGTRNVVNIDTLNIGSPSILEVSRTYIAPTTTETTTQTPTTQPSTTDVYMGIIPSNTTVEVTEDDTNVDQLYKVPENAMRIWFSTSQVFNPDGSGYGLPLDTDLPFDLILSPTQFGDGWITQIIGRNNLNGINLDSYPGITEGRTISGIIPAGQKQGYIDMRIDNTQTNYSFSVEFNFINGSNRFEPSTPTALQYGWTANVGTDQNDARIGFLR